MSQRMTKALANGLARYEVATRMRGGPDAERISPELAKLAYGDRGVPPEVVRELIARAWICSAGPGRGYMPTVVGRAHLARALAKVRT